MLRSDYKGLEKRNQVCLCASDVLRKSGWCFKDRNRTRQEAKALVGIKAGPPALIACHTYSDPKIEQVPGPEPHPPTLGEPNPTHSRCRSRA